MVQDHLAAALRAAKSQAWAEALGPLLTVWRDHPSSVLATAIEEVSRRALEHVPRPIAQSAGTLNAMWFTQAKKGNPAVIGQLCTTLRNTRRSNDLMRRIEMLLAHGSDPRVAMAVCDVVERSTYPVLQPELKQFWSRLFSWLPELGDPRVSDRARSFAETWATQPEADRAALLARLDDTMPALIAAYPEHEPLGFDDREICFAIARAARTLTLGDDAPAEEAALLAAIYAAPDADEPRMIYADWLEQRGSPRGEFIALQLAKARITPTPAQAGRERALLHTFGAEWKAPLVRAEFSRGFIAISNDDDLLGRDPRLATLIRSNSVPESDDTHVPVLRWIDKADDPQIDRLASLAKPLAVEHLGWSPSFIIDGQPHLNAPLHAFARIRVLPQLRSLVIHAGPIWAWSNLRLVPIPELVQLLAAPCMRSLRMLEMRYLIGEVVGLVAAASPTSLSTVTITAMGDREICKLVFERDSRGALGNLAISFPWWPFDVALAKGLLEAIRKLPPDQLTRVSVDRSMVSAIDRSGLRQRFAYALRRQTALDEFVF